MAQSELIDVELEKWIEKPDLNLTDLDNNKSIKSNFMITARNFLNLKKWISGLLVYIRYLRKLFDIDNIVAEVQRRLRTQKLYFPITMYPESEIIYHTDPVTKLTYKIYYKSDTEIEITSEDDKYFVTNQMMVMVKNPDGFIVYPVIKTKGNMISIFFADSISENYIVYII